VLAFLLGEVRTSILKIVLSRKFIKMSTRNISVLMGACLSFIFISCGSEGEKSLIEPSGNSTSAQTPAMPVMLPSTNNAATITPQSQPASTAAPALNPAHGQPGHRCDLAVGAPLPGAAAVNINPQPSVASVNPVINNAAAPKNFNISGSSAPVAGSPKLNPAHGQPGHRCDISVGAPLPDAGAAVQPTPTVTAPPVNNPTPVLNLPNGNAGIKVNPAHGQPGHRCDIAVGAPIK
jgi:hypothetical protein